MADHEDGHFNYLVTAHKPSSVLHAAVGRLTSPDDLNLVLNKCTRLEVYTLTQHGLRATMEVPLYGRVTALKLFRVPGERTDRILVLTDKLQLAVLQVESGRLVTRAAGDVSDRVGRLAMAGHIAAVDPLGRLIVLHLYDSHLKVIAIDEAGNLAPAFNAKLDELSVLDVTFLDAGPREPPSIAVLYEDSLQDRHVTTYVINLRTRDLEPGDWAHASPDSGCCMLLPVAGTGGTIVVGSATATYLDARDVLTVPLPSYEVETYGAGPAGSSSSAGGGPGPSSSAEAPRPGPSSSAGPGPSATAAAAAPASYRPPPTVRTAALIDAETGCYVLGDSAGALSLLAPRRDARTGLVEGLALERVGRATAPSCLAYLDAGLVFVGSCEGDSVVVRLRTGSEDEGTEDGMDTEDEASRHAPSSFVEVLDTQPGLGSIVDFCLLDLDGSGQGAVVTCSGLGASGSLRVVRSGVGFAREASLDLSGITEAWSLRGASGSGGQGAGGGRGSADADASAAAGADGGVDTPMGGVAADSPPPEAAPGAPPSRVDAPSHELLVLGFVGVTRALGAEAGGCVAEAEVPGLACGEATLLAADAALDQWVQVTPRAVRLIDRATRRLLLEWVPEGRAVICAAAARGAYVAVAVDGTGLVVLRTRAPGHLEPAGSARLADEIACLDLRPGVPPRDDDEGGLVAVGTWGLAVELRALGPDLPVTSSCSVGGDIIPRSVLLASFGPDAGDEYLLAGLGDGVLASWRVRAGGGLSSPKRVALGTQPVSLRRLEREVARPAASPSAGPASEGGGAAAIPAPGGSASQGPPTGGTLPANGVAVFAGCDRPTLVHASGRSLLYSNLDARGVQRLVAFDTVATPGLLAVVSEAGVDLGRLDDLRRLHVRSVPLGESPRRLAHQPETATLAVLVTSDDASGAAPLADTPPDAVRLLDAGSFKTLDRYNLDQYEMGWAVASIVLESSGAGGPGAVAAVLPGGGGGSGGGEASRPPGPAAATASRERRSGGPPAPGRDGPSSRAFRDPEAARGSSRSDRHLFVVGTALALPNESEPTQGRLLLFSAAGGKLELLAQAATSGGIYSLLPHRGALLAGVGSRVQVFSVTESGEDAFGPGSSLASAAPPGRAAPPAALRLVPGSSAGAAVMTLFLDAQGSFVAAGDVMKSVTLFQSSGGVGGVGGDSAGGEDDARPRAEDRDRERPAAASRARRCPLGLSYYARDYEPSWLSAMAFSGPRAVLCADVGFNLVSLAVAPDGAPDEERTSLERVAEFHVGEMINRVRAGSLVPRPPDGDLARIPLGLFGTANGALGVVACLPPAHFEFLSALERALASTLQGIGGMSHSAWRAFREPSLTAVDAWRPARGIVDGDLVERFLELSPEDQERVLGRMRKALGAPASPDGRAGEERAGAAPGDLAREDEPVGPSRDHPLLPDMATVTRVVEDLVRLH